MILINTKSVSNNIITMTMTIFLRSISMDIKLVGVLNIFILMLQLLLNTNVT